jgi:glycosyltransferase involved in cell wall biosynthesis
MAHDIAINARFLAQSLTGVQRYALELVKALDRLVDQGAMDHRKKHSPVLMAPKGLGADVPGLKRIPLRRVGRLEGNPWVQLELPYYARGSVLWSPANTGPVYHRRQVVTIHDASVFDHPEGFNAKFVAWYRFILPRLAKRAARLLTNSEFSRDRLAHVLNIDPELIFVVPAAVDSRFKPVEKDELEAVRKRLGLPPDYVLALGSLEPRKNIAGLFGAWSLLLAQRRIDEKLYLVVTGGRSSLYREAGTSQPPARVVLTGYVEDKDLPALYSGASAFVYPSLYEGFGLPPLEAMACGVPVVTSNSTSIPEVVGDAALLVDPTEVESIADGLYRLLASDALRTSLKEAGFGRVKLFSWDSSARLVWDHLVSVAEGG